MYRKYSKESIVGEKHGDLTIVKHSRDEVQMKANGSRQIRHYVICRCKCGREYEIRYDIFTRTNRCSFCKDIMLANIDHSYKHYSTHGMSRTRIAHIFRNMVSRCYNPSDIGYCYYGKRGITICQEWYNGSNDYSTNGFLRFVEWAYANGYYDQPEDTPRNRRLTIDRIDTDGPYSPDNCRWVTSYTQSNNRRNIKHIIVDDCQYSYYEFERKHGYKPGYISTKLQQGWSISAVVKKILHPDIHLRRIRNHYVDSDGYTVLIPTPNNTSLYGR